MMVVSTLEATRKRTGKSRSNLHTGQYAGSVSTDHSHGQTLVEPLLLPGVTRRINKFLCKTTQKGGNGLATRTSGLNCHWLKVVIALEVMIFLAFCGLSLCGSKTSLSGRVFIVALINHFAVAAFCALKDFGTSSEGDRNTELIRTEQVSNASNWECFWSGFSYPQYINLIINEVWHPENLPEDWTRGIILPFWKRWQAGLQQSPRYNSSLHSRHSFCPCPTQLLAPSNPLLQATTASRFHAKLLNDRPDICSSPDHWEDSRVS